MISKPPAERLELRDIDSLTPSARNARTHSELQISEIAGSIVAFGFMVPVLVDSDGNIIAGHARVLAARKLKLERVPVIVVDHLSEAEKRAYVIADNKIALNAGWDEELLKVELESLKSEGVNLERLGFSEDEFNQLLDNLSPGPQPDEDSAPESPIAPITQVGDIWRLGEHMLLCGDALDGDSYAAVLAGETAQMVFTDPPYNVDYRAPGLGVGIANDDLGKNFGPFLEGACTQMLRNTTGALYICMSSSELHTLYSAFTKTGGHWSTFIIWGKNTFTLGRSDYQRQFETDSLWLARKRPALLVRRSRSRGPLDDRSSTNERSAPHHEARRAGGTGCDEQQPSRRDCSRSVWRFRFHSDRLRKIRPAGSPDRAGTKTLRCNHRSLAGVFGRHSSTRRNGGDVRGGGGETIRSAGLHSNHYPLRIVKPERHMPRGKPFEPGNKLGRGRPRGSRNRTILIAQQLLDSHAEPLVRTCLLMALKGDPKAMHLCMDRILPVRRDMPVNLGSLPTATAEQLSAASEKITDKVAADKLTLTQGHALAALLAQRGRIIETRNLDERLRKLEVQP